MPDTQFKIGPADQIIARLQQQLGIDPNKRGAAKATATLLGISPQALVRWRVRDFVGVDKIVALCMQRNVDMNLVFRGQPIEAQELQYDLELLAVKTPRDPVVEFENLREAVNQMGKAIGVPDTVRNEGNHML